MNTPVEPVQKTAAPIIDVFHYGMDGSYVGTGKSTNDPIEGKRMLPARATLIAPPNPTANTIAVFDEATQAWVLHDDFRGDVYRVSDGGIEQWGIIGALPSTYTNQPPPNSQHRWDAKTSAWVLDLARVRADKIAALNSDYQALRRSVITHAGSVFQGDDASINTLAGTLTAINNGWKPPKSFAWVDADNTPHLADLPFLQGLAAAMANAKAQQFGQLQAAKNAVKTATMKTAINAVVL